jgi:hypothetical protein
LAILAIVHCRGVVDQYHTITLTGKWNNAAHSANYPACRIHFQKYSAAVGTRQLGHFGEANRIRCEKIGPFYKPINAEKEERGRNKS